jgi:tetratricopeptide (TPR) repeat protein
MCIQPNTTEYDQGMEQLALLTRLVASGAATGQTFLDRAEWFQLMGAIPSAVRDYDRAFERRDELTDDQLAFLHVKRGVCYRRLSRYEDALVDLNQAIALKPQKAYHWSCRGIVRYHQGEFELARGDLSRAIELDPQGDERSWEVRALCHQVLGDHQAAIDDLTQRLAMDVAPYTMLYVYRAYSYMLLGRYDEALHDCLHGQRIDDHSGTFDLYRLLGHVRFARGEAGQALGDFSKALALAPEVGELHLWRGLVFRALGDEAAAADDFTEFVQRHPDGAAQALFDLSHLFSSAAAPVFVAPAAIAA